MYYYCRIGAVTESLGYEAALTVRSSVDKTHYFLLMLLMLSAECFVCCLFSLFCFKDFRGSSAHEQTSG